MGFYSDYDIEDVRSQSATKEVRDNGPAKWRVVIRDHGNCSLFNRMAGSEKLKLGNVTIDPAGQHLIANVEAIGQGKSFAGP